MADSTRPDSRESNPRIWAWGDAPAGLVYFVRAGGLFFITYAVWSLLTSGLGAPRIALAVVAIALFAALVRPGIGARRSEASRAGRLAVVIVGAIALVASFFTFQDASRGTSVALFLCAAMGGAGLRPDRRAIAAIGLVTLDAFLLMTWNWRNLEASGPAAIEISLLGLTAYSVGVLRRTNMELHQARHDLARLAVAEERVRIARDLHDTLGQSLTLIALKAELVERLVDTEPARARLEAGAVRRAAREALTSVRETVSGYRQPELHVELEGVRAALAVAGIRASVEAPPYEAPLPARVDSVLAWAVREAGTNVVRHSGAKHARISVGAAGDVAFAEITDDGQGRPHPLPVVRGSGLMGLAERVEAQGGRLEAGPRSEGGFRLRVTVPLGSEPSSAVAAS